MTNSFSYLEPVCCSMSSSVASDLHIGFSRGRSGGLVVPSLQNFPQFIVIHTVKGFGIVNKAELDIFLGLSCFSVVSNSVRPQRRQATRLLRPWDSPGENTRVDCHFLLQCMEVKSESEVAQSCLTPSDPMDCSPPGSSVHGICQARILEWVAIAFSAFRHNAHLIDYNRVYTNFYMH